MKKVPDLLLLLGRGLLGFVFLYAGWEKVGDAHGFAESIANYHLLPKKYELFAGVFVPWLEMVVGITLVLGILAQASAAISTCLSFCFAMFVGSALYRGLNVDCGCFSGESDVSKLHLIGNFFLLLVSGCVALLGPGRYALDSKWIESNEKKLSLIKVSTSLFVFVIVLFSFNVISLKVHGLRVKPSRPSVILQEGQGKIEFRSQVLDLGRVSQENQASVVAEYTNVGMGEAVITKVESTCGCTEAKPVKTRLLPGESSKLRIFYSPGANIGKISQSVTIYQEGRADPILLNIVGEVESMVKAEPLLLQMSPGEVVDVALSSTRPGFVPTVSGLSSGVPGLKILSLEKGAKGMPIVKLRLDTPVPDPPGQANAWPVHIGIENGPPCVLYLQAKEHAR